MGRFSRVLRWSVFAALLFLLVTWLWFDVANDCTGQGNYSGCPHHLVDPFPLLVPYGLGLAAILGALFAGAHVSSPASAASVGGSGPLREERVGGGSGGSSGRAGISDVRLMAIATLLVAAVLTAMEWWLTGDFWLIN